MTTAKDLKLICDCGSEGWCMHGTADTQIEIARCYLYGESIEELADRFFRGDNARGLVSEIVANIEEKRELIDKGSFVPPPTWRHRNPLQLVDHYTLEQIGSRAGQLIDVCKELQDRASQTNESFHIDEEADFLESISAYRQLLQDSHESLDNALALLERKRSDR